MHFACIRYKPDEKKKRICTQNYALFPSVHFKLRYLIYAEYRAIDIKEIKTNKYVVPLMYAAPYM